MQQQVVVRRGPGRAPLVPSSAAAAAAAAAPPLEAGRAPADGAGEARVGLVQLWLDASGRNESGRGGRDGLFLARVAKVEEPDQTKNVW